MIVKRLYRPIVVLTLLAFAIQIFAPAMQASAYFGRAERYGYFSNARGAGSVPYCDRNYCGGSWSSYVFPVAAEGRAIPFAYVGNCTNPADLSCVNQLIGLLQWYNRLDGSGNDTGDTARQIAGAGFIVHTMLGRTGPSVGDGGRYIGNADWTELRNRLNNAQQQGWINWSTPYTAGISTYSLDIGQNFGGRNNSNRGDVVWEGSSQYDPNAIVISGPGFAYSLFRLCANPGGESNGLPVALNFSLTPNMDANVTRNTVVESGSTMTINPTVTNTGQTASTGAAWELSKFVVAASPPGTYPLTLQTNNSTPQAHYGNAWTRLDGGTTAFPTGGPTAVSTAAIKAQTIGAYPSGTKICFALSVRPYTQDDGRWRHSEPFCVLIGKKPKTQVHAGDLSVGKSFLGAGSVSSKVLTARSDKQIAGVTRSFGSWIEYGIFASGAVTGAASGSAYAGPGLLSATNCNVATLTPSNVTSGRGVPSCTNRTATGSYATSRSIPDVTANYPGTGTVIAAGSVVANSLTASGTYIGSKSGDLSLSASTLLPGKSIILKVSGTVTITGNQTYSPGPYTAIDQLPQLVIIADKIIVQSTVTQVDGWLIANGAQGIVETCDTGSATYVLTGAQRLTSAKCNTKLTVNGPVMAKHLWLRRTFGADLATAAEPGEVFNLRPDTYLWAKAQGDANSRVQTVYTTELPPRL